jgi:hypothetical protein
MGLFSNEDKPSEETEEHNRGQEEGAHETLWDQLTTPRIFESSAHEKGRENGHRNRPDEPDEESDDE